MGLTVDFFHDVVCGWCFNISPRLRVLAGEFDIEVRHRTFVLQDSPEQMIAVFGSMDQAKGTILGHWAACRAASDTPELFNIDGMRAAAFDYPYGLPAALFCKAAERLSGQDAAGVSVASGGSGKEGGAPQSSISRSVRAICAGAERRFVASLGICAAPRRF